MTTATSRRKFDVTGSAERYAAVINQTGIIRESKAGFPCSERHLQCFWADPALCPHELLTITGERVQLVDRGRWNLGAGPDFIEARLLAGDGRVLSGDVEVHLEAAGWDAHGHSDDPRYRRVIAHLTYHRPTRPVTGLPPHALEIALEPVIAAMPTFSLYDIDTAAYPYAALSLLDGETASLTAAWSIEECQELLESAGLYRLRRKAERLDGLIQKHGCDEALYHELMRALGYRRNANAMAALATRVPLRDLRSCQSVTQSFALLLGVAGLLPTELPRRWSTDNRAYVRHLWDHYWRVQDAWSTAAMTRAHWQLAGCRPLNHPVRRLAAGAALMLTMPELSTTIAALPRESPRHWASAADQLLTQARGDDFWKHHLSLGGAHRPRGANLIGAARRSAIIINLFLPYLLRQGHAVGSLAHALPPEHRNGPAREAAALLFGRDHNTIIYQRSALRQQGLLQLFNDFIQGSGDNRDHALATALAHYGSSVETPWVNG